MFPTLVRLSKASRAPLTSKRANKDFYKGTRQAALPGDRRTGAPGRHIIRGTGKYKLDDTKVRYYVAPPLRELASTKLRPYVTASLDERIETADRVVRNYFTPQIMFEEARKAAFRRALPLNVTVPRDEWKAVKAASKRAAS